MMRMLRVVAVAALTMGRGWGVAQAGPAVQQGDYLGARVFHFRSASRCGMKLHYRTLGAPHRDAQGTSTMLC